MPRLFDVYIAVDWSSANSRSPARPTRNAVWVGEKIAPGVTDTTVVGETYHRTRQACLVHVRDRLLHHASNGRRVFLGFDFAYGYPAGYAAALKLTSDSSPWRQIWKELAHLISDGEDNVNNRFEVAAELNARCGGPTPGPLWGCPAGKEGPTLRSTSPGYTYMVEFGLTLERLRSVERRQSGAQETWKLFYTGSVGGQILVGIPAVCELRDDAEFTAFSRVWPFETGFTSAPTPEEGPFILHVEIFPSSVPDQLDSDVCIRDQAQVRAVVRWLSRLDAAGQLGALFTEPDGLTREALDACVREEGWIIGV